MSEFCRKIAILIIRRYDIADYQDVHAPYGSLANIDAIIAGCHARGLKILFDLVVNHTSHQHAWFEESRSSKDNLKRDWVCPLCSPPLMSVTKYPDTTPSHANSTCGSPLRWSMEFARLQTTGRAVLVDPSGSGTSSQRKCVLLRRARAARSKLTLIALTVLPSCEFQLRVYVGSVLIVRPSEVLLR